MEQKIKSDCCIGKNLRRLRLEHGSGVTELAKTMQLLGCDITRECINKIEAGKRNISVDQLSAFKKALNVSYEQIFEYEEE